MRVWLIGLIGLMMAVMAGAAFAEARNFPAGVFTRVDARAGVNVELRIGATFSVVAEGHTEALERLIVVNEGDALIVTMREPAVQSVLPFASSAVPAPHVRITAPRLSAVEVQSGAQMLVHSATATGFLAEVAAGADLELRELSAAQAGLRAISGARMSVSGSCGILEVKAEAGAAINAEALDCETARAEAQSGASIKLRAAIAQVLAYEGGHIEVWGAQQLEARELAGGTVVRRN